MIFSIPFLRNNHSYHPIESVIIFFIFAVLFTCLQLDPSFPDPDSFYHARLASLMTTGPILHFPWLPLTTLSDIFIDHHFLYHVLLLPFVTLTHPLIGIKIATIIFAALLLSLFYSLLRNNTLIGENTRLRALCFLAILALNAMFMFRINMAKIPAVSLIFFLFGLLALAYRNARATFGLSFLFVWLYGGWPILPGASIFAWIALSSSAIPETKKIRSSDLLSFPALRQKTATWMRELRASLMQYAHAKLALAATSGALAGLIVNPYFPTNLSFYWIQTFKIAALNVLSQIGVGSEWYPAGVSFIPAHGLTLIALVFATCVFFLPKLFSDFLHTPIARRTWQQWMLCALAYCFLALSLKSRRYGEYFAPIAVLFCASVLMQIMTSTNIRMFFQLLKNILEKPLSFKAITVLYFLLAIPAILIINVSGTISSYKNGYAFSQYENGMRWITNNVPKNSLIFHNRWDDFPLFFYSDQSHRYISGLDPRFLLYKNEKFAKDYDALALGSDLSQQYGYRSLCMALLNKKSGAVVPQECTTLSEKNALVSAIGSFGSRTMILTHLDEKESGIKEKIRSIPDFHELYRDNEMIVYQTNKE